MAEIIEGQGVELAPVETTVLGVTDPEHGLAGIERFAHELQPKLAKMTQRISGRDYLGNDALTMVATALGAVGVITETTRLENGYEAKAEARMVADGRVVGAGVSVCTRDESGWSRRPDFALLGMAQTRAVNRALRGLVGAIVELASYPSVAAEEIAEPDVAEPELPKWATPAANDALVEAAPTFVRILKAANVPEPGPATARIGAAVRERCGGTVPRCVLAVFEAIAAEIPAETDEP